MIARPKKSQSRREGYLDGQLLIAMPGMTDKRFARSVIYVCAHSSDGAMGLIINQEAASIDLLELLQQLNILPRAARATLAPRLEAMPVQIGGPVETGRGFVLHSSDYHAESSTLAIDADVSLTATIDILKALAENRGPSRAILALGYSGWAPGQLEREIAANGWLHGPADMDLVFDFDLDSKYDRAMSKLGIDISFLASEAGHA